MPEVFAGRFELLDPIGTGGTGTVLAPAQDPVAAVQAVLRAVASASELEAASDLLAGEHPELAEALRVLGTSRTPEARAYYARVTGSG